MELNVAGESTFSLQRLRQAGKSRPYKAPGRGTLYPSTIIPTTIST
jgi:hypothetical protein